MANPTCPTAEPVPTLPPARRSRACLRLALIFALSLTLGLLQLLALQPVEARNADTSAMTTLPNVSAAAQDTTWLSHTSEIASTFPISVYLPFVGRDYRTPVSYLDDFSNPQSGWATGDTGNTRRSYVDGEYEILVRNPGWWAGALCPADKVVNYSVEADMRNDAGAGIYGLIFGWVDWDHFYLFEVSPDIQRYAIMRRDTTWVPLIPWTYSPEVFPYGTTNRLKVERQGAQITVYVNNELLQTIVDGTYSGEIQTGLYAQADAQSAATARFDNFHIEER
jgi:hypothetical protein